SSADSSPRSPCATWTAETRYPRVPSTCQRQVESAPPETRHVTSPPGSIRSRRRIQDSTRPAGELSIPELCSHRKRSERGSAAPLLEQACRSGGIRRGDSVRRRMLERDHERCGDKSLDTVEEIADAERVADEQDRRLRALEHAAQPAGEARRRLS